MNNINNYKHLVENGKTPKDISTKFGISVVTLSTWRRKNIGPRYYKIGNRVIYTEQNVIDYIIQNEIIPSGNNHNNNTSNELENIPKLNKLNMSKVEDKIKYFKNKIKSIGKNNIKNMHHLEIKAWEELPSSAKKLCI